MRKIKLIQNTQSAHRCVYCNNKIHKGSRAIAIVETNDDMKFISYLCDNNFCMNELEIQQQEK